MSFEIIGEQPRHALFGDETGGIVRVSASTWKQAVVYAERPHTKQERTQSLGMTPEQARGVAALLLKAADWCDANPHET